SPWSWWTTAPRPTAGGRAGSRRTSRSAGGRRSAFPAATMPRWLRHSGSRRRAGIPVPRADLSSWWPRSRERSKEIMTDMRTVFAAEASELLEEDPLTAVVLAEISADLFGKAAARHPDRVLNVGIREQLMVSVGGGLALAGMRPIVHTYAPFLVERAFEQVKLDL